MRRAVSFLLHASVAMVISPIVVFAVFLIAVIIFNNSPGINSAIGAGGVASPVLWGPGLILGLLVNRFALKEHRLLGLAGRDSLDGIWDICFTSCLPRPVSRNLFAAR